MNSTTTLGLPLVQPSQAQKHVTVNEALVRLDALAQLTLASRSLAQPPASPAEGDCYAVPAGAEGDWSGKDGQVALFVNGGWAFVQPRSGWRAWIADEGTAAQFVGADWDMGSGVLSPSGVATTFRVVETDHAVTAGAASETAAIIPAQSIVFGVTGRVLTTITGTATSWRLGIGGISDNRYGNGLGLAEGSWLRGITSEPLAYYSDTPLTLTGKGGDLSGGVVRLAVHLAELALPRQ